MLLFLTAFFGFVPAPERLPEKAPSLACKIVNSYIGNVVDFEYTLEIKDKAPVWKYTAIDRSFRGLPFKPTKLTLQGEYEVQGDLAFFTVTSGGAGKFGLNFQRVKETIFFNRFFLQPDGRLAYVRQWFARRDGAWQPSRLVRLSFAPPDPKALKDDFGAVVTGQDVRWDDAGKQTVAPITLKLRYKRRDGLYFALEGDNPLAKTLPEVAPLIAVLLLRIEDGRVISAGPGRSINDLQGFVAPVAAP
ncbi:MAG: hypothetical protein U0793_19325 [Gemmataceae bacterium]